MINGFFKTTVETGDTTTLGLVVEVRMHHDRELYERVIDAIRHALHGCDLENSGKLTPSSAMNYHRKSN